jgi:hypothetical protein
VQNGGDFSGFGILFNMKMMVDSVHGSWTTGGSVHHGPLDSADRRPPERGGMLAEVRARTAPELGSSPASVGCGEGRTVKPARRSLGLARRCGGRAMTASQRRERNSKVVMFDLGQEGRRRGMSAVRVRCRPPPFIGPEGGGGAGGFNGHPRPAVKRWGGIYV